MTPKDYEVQREPQEVRDYAAERGIKWNGIAQSLILLSIAGVFAFSVQFGGNVLDKFDEVNATLTQIRDIVAAVNTKAEVNATRHDVNDKKNDQQDTLINQNTQAIYQMRISDEN